MIQTRHVAAVYLPTVGLWSLVQGFRYYSRH